MSERHCCNPPYSWAAARYFVGWMGQSIPQHSAIMTPDSTLRETNCSGHRDVTSAAASGAAKYKLQAKRRYFFSFLCDNSVNIFDKYVLYISLKI